MLLGHGWALFILAAWGFLSVGSFLNVVIFRFPVMLERGWRDEARAILQISDPVDDAEPFNLLVPRSHCPRCQQLISAWQNIPILSWLILRGKCHHCGEPISLRYPAIELLTLIMSALVLATWGYQWLTLALLLFTWVLIALTFIDFDTQLLPDQITLPLVWGGVLVALVFDHVAISDSVIGAVVGYTSLWSLYWIHKLITGKEGMGYGDFKLLAALGAWLGWQALPGVILLASVAGLLYALLCVALRGMRREDPIPFGPFLATAGWVTLLFRDDVLAFYLG
ncbi:MAG: A24 family peptidase [Gammaproteobacteria bacterium]|nr:A24 family peptidase [Gammaproteobacteria bacterium]